MINSEQISSSASSDLYCLFCLFCGGVEEKRIFFKRKNQKNFERIHLHMRKV